VDTSAIPLAVVDRVEVVTGGRSAVYGSDAVAGVVNIVTRQDFAGAESQLSYGGADIGAERLQFSQIVGGRFAHGGVVAAYDYGREWPLNLVETGLMADPSSWGVINIRTEQQTEGTRHTAYLSGHFALSEHIELQGEGLYTNKDYEGHNRNRSLNPGVMQDSTDFFKHSSDQYSLQASANVDLPNSWALKVNGGTSVTENLLDFSGYLDLGFFAFPNEIIIDTKTEVSSLAAVVDGTLFSIAGLTPRTAIGVEVRGEDYNSITPTGSNTSDGVRDRTIRSAFAELLVPFADNTLELSIAGRYDEYSDFGDTFNPQYGVVWRAARGLALRGAYSTAFRAPTLFEGSDQAFATMGNRTDPVTGGLSPVLFWRGQNPNLGPEEAKTWSAGVDYEPEFASWIRLSASYFEVNYEDRIDTPAFNSDLGTILLQEERYGDFIDRNPSAALIEAMFDSLHGRFLGNSTGRTYDSSNRDPAVLLAVFPDLIVFDNRAQNTAISDINGIDFNANGRWSTAAGLVSVGVNAAYTLNYKRKLTLTSPAFNNLNEVGKPVDLRVRSNAGLSRGSLGVYFQVNYVDSYRDPFSFVTPTAGGRMDSWTTVDATFRFNGSDTDGIWEGFSAALSIDNLLDQDPPEYLNSFSDLRYDAANASPLGRYVTVRIVKRW
jgi:outer membrane receptor protein involved in Fe transport